MIKEIVKPLMPDAIMNWVRRKNYAKSFKQWEKQGFPVPAPHLYKQRLIREYQRRYQFSTLIETGTYLGEMVEAQKRYFQKIISIELSPELFAKAQNRFRNQKHVSIHQGDSGRVLPLLMKEIDQAAIFWLDGHYSKGITARGDKDCPIFEELRAIFDHGHFNHVLLIDDARCFVGDGEYPTISELTDFILAKYSKSKVSVKHDIIRVELQAEN